MDKKSSNGIDITQVISENFSGMTKSEKRIANFVRKNQDESSFLSAAEVAKRLDLSEATIVRFSRTLGYPSYPAFRSHLQQHFRERITHASRLRSRLDDMREEGDIFERLTVTEIDYLSQALESVDRKSMKKAVQLLREHERIFVFGLGPSITLVDLLEIRLRRFGKDVVCLKSSGRELLESLLNLRSSDLLFVICFFDLNPALKLLLEYSHEVGCKSIMLTDTLDAILGDQADIVLAARRGPMGEFHSLVVPMTVINALLLSVAGENKEKILPVLDKLDSLRNRLESLNSSNDLSSTSF